MGMGLIDWIDPSIAHQHYRWLNCSGGLCVYIAEGLGLHRATR